MTIKLPKIPLEPILALRFILYAFRFILFLLRFTLSHSGSLYTCTPLYSILAHGFILYLHSVSSIRTPVHSILATIKVSHAVFYAPKYIGSSGILGYKVGPAKILRSPQKDTRSCKLERDARNCKTGVQVGYSSLVSWA